MDDEDPFAEGLPEPTEPLEEDVSVELDELDELESLYESDELDELDDLCGWDEPDCLYGCDGEWCDELCPVPPPDPAARVRAPVPVPVVVAAAARVAGVMTRATVARRKVRRAGWFMGALR
ncbi:hypothetical protein [Kitasatospora sp. NPDC096140]|uniref:hypothetical protein n=1 Tax=Kitasatospora sp. NPDC096140 TaxID=3155425 RepID=UPI0033323F58